MATLMIRLLGDKHERLKVLAQHRAMSVNKLIEELAMAAIAAFDACTHFKALAATGNPTNGLSLLEKLDALTEKKQKP